jgi:hypothetical protein
VKKGKGLGGKGPRRGGKLSRRQEPERAKIDGSQLLALTVGCLLVGTVAGFGWAMDRQLRGGLLEQRTEAMERPDWVSVSALPAFVPRTFLAVVDPTHEDGGPVRPRDASRTIPRELVREIHLLGSGLGGQAKEMMMAPILEQRVTGDALLELYLNRVYFGIAHDYPVYGIHYAAREFFGKEPSQLTLGETASLAGLLLEPRIERPDEVPGAVGVRRNEVLANLLRRGYITEADMQAAVAERLAFQPGLTEVPMTRQDLAVMDTAVIRLPPPNPPEEESPTAN